MRLFLLLWLCARCDAKAVAKRAPRTARAAVAATGGGASSDAWEILPPLVVASVLTAAITYPLDFLRAIKMASAGDSAVAAVGFGDAARRFTKGLAPEIAKGTVSRVLKFGGFPVAHRLLWGADPSHGTARSRAAAGALATVPEMALCTPLEVGKLALQLDAMAAAPAYKNSIRVAAAALVGAGGPAALYCGYAALQCRQAIWTAVYFATRPLFLAALAGDADPSPLALGVAGLGAGVAGALCNNPVDVVRSVAQKNAIGAYAAGTAVGRVGAPTVAAARSVVRARGVAGLWSGAPYKAAHLGLGGALMAVFQPACTRLWARRRRASF